MAIRVVIVDDDPDIRFIASRILSAEEMETAEAEDLEQLLEVLDGGFKADLILLDLTLPGASGWTVLTRLQSNPDYAKIPVVILTGHDDPEFKNAAKNRGVAGYITKPFREWELSDTVKRTVSRKLRRDPWAR